MDTAKTFHKLVARGPDGHRTKAYKVLVSRAGFEAADVHLRSLFPGVAAQQFLVGLEFAGHHGFTFAHFLAQRGYVVVNVLAAHTKASKEIEDNNPRKDDAKDAAQVCRLVGDGIFVRFPFLEHPYLELRLLTVHRHRLTVEATRFKNRLQGLLDLAWPEFLGHFSALHKATPRAILGRWPLPEDLLAAPPRTVRKEIRAASRGHVSPEQVDALFDSARTSIALTQASPERRLEIQSLLARWALVREQLAELERRITALVDACPEAKVLTTVPEVSAVCAATFVAELGTPKDYAHYRQVLKLAGMNLASRSSGQSEGRKWQSKRGPPDAAPPAVPARRPLVPQPRAVSPGLSGAQGAQWWGGDESRLHLGPQARADAVAGDAVREAVRPRALAGEPPPSGSSDLLKADS